MPVRVVTMESAMVSVHDNQHTALEFTQQLANTKSRSGDSRPFFVADLGRVQTALAQWQQHLPRVRPFYSLACNATPVLLRLLSAAPSVGFYCKTRQCVDTALEYVDGERVFYSNPCWTRATMRQANTAAIGTIGFESAGDLTRFANENTRARLVLNVALDATADDESAFGCPLDRAADLLAMAAELDLNCVGVGFNLGSSMLPRFAALDRAVEIASHLLLVGRSFGLMMSAVSLGGGFPSLHAAPNSPSFASVCARVNNSLDRHLPFAIFGDIEIIATPGRFFAASMFSLCTSIERKLEVDASAITNDDFDAGRRGFVYGISEGFYGAFGCRAVANNNPKCAPLFDDNNETDENLFYGSIVGPHETADWSFDMVESRCRLRQMHEGDWLHWTNMGGYSFNNCASLDDDEPRCDSPSVYYYANESDWKAINRNMDTPSPLGVWDIDQRSDGGSVTNTDDESWIYEIDMD